MRWWKRQGKLCVDGRKRARTTVDRSYKAHGYGWMCTLSVSVLKLLARWWRLVACATAAAAEIVSYVTHSLPYRL